ncbi:MAG: hypothetical protein CVV44_04135 [Spirochaetae bacterium HGW-Spirochaetae-1]|jgi:hypothetical protein|nr:MAG: hypothetical protein CVV44_04135 [Spirochaetae bacterium HGW-Spirochaetae-1]
MITELELTELLQKVWRTEPFSLTYTGKKHKKIDGLYRPELREIVINNRNFSNDTELIYTALHEYAHHVQNTVYFMKSNPHDTEFWRIFHELLFEAEKIGVYKNAVRGEFKNTFDLLLEVNEKFNAAMMEFFLSMENLKEVMGPENINQFTDACERCLKLPRGEAKKISALARLGETGFQYNVMMKLAGMKDISGPALDKLRFEKPGQPADPAESISYEIFKHMHAGQKYETELEYLKDLKEKVGNAVERGKEKVLRLAAKIGRLMRGRNIEEVGA